MSKINQMYLEDSIKAILPYVKCYYKKDPRCYCVHNGLFELPMNM